MPMACYPIERGCRFVRHPLFSHAITWLRIKFVILIKIYELYIDFYATWILWDIWMTDVVLRTILYILSLTILTNKFLHNSNYESL